MIDQPWGFIPELKLNDNIIYRKEELIHVLLDISKL